MTSPLLTHWFPVRFHASSILEFGVASNNPPKAQGTSDVHLRRYEGSRRYSTWRERSTGNQCVSKLGGRRHHLPRALAKRLLQRLNLATQYPFYLITRIMLKLIYS